jgi:hypothetical protein
MKGLEQNTLFWSSHGTLTSEWLPAKARSVAFNRLGRSGLLPRGSGPRPASPRRPSRRGRRSRSQEDSRDAHQSAVGKCRMVNSI